jgi:succinate dehydrogenase / fumarate reductase, cytochrome b subunit
MSQTPATPRRPLSPHLQVWRWHATMFASIVNRITGVGSILGILMAAFWLAALGATASGIWPHAYTLFITCAASPIGLLVWFGLSLAGFVHLMGGVRHLIWDLGIGLDIKSANGLAIWSLLIGVGLTLAFWALLFVSGKVVLAL